MDIVEMFAIEDEILNNSISKNKISVELLKLCKELGKNLQPIGFCTEDVGVIDLVTIKLPNGQELWESIIDFYEIVLECSVDRTNINTINGLVLDYFMRLGICYVEVIKDTYYKDSKYSVVSQKFLSTENEVLLSQLVYDCRAEDYRMYMSEIFNKYGSNLEIDLNDMAQGTMRYLKVQYEKERKVIRCNKNLDYTKIRFVCLPLVMEWLKGVNEVMENNLVKINYMKDDGTDRSIITTVNYELLTKFYESEYATAMIRNSTVPRTPSIFGETPFDGNLERGWVRIPEVGSSTIDDTGVRALNFARITKLEVVNPEDVDTSYINVSLNNVITIFENIVNILVQQNEYQKVFRIYVGLQHLGFTNELKKLPNSFNSIYEIAKELREFVSSKKYAGTPFLRILHSYMVSEPALFNNYTGEKLQVKKRENYGVAEMDF